MAERNERKALVLGLLLRQGSLISRDLVERWQLSPSDASQILANYQHQGLLSRKKEPGPGPPVYRYHLTLTGRRKAEWMMRQTLIQAPEQLSFERLEPEEPSERIRPVLREERLRPKLRE